MDVRIRKGIRLGEEADFIPFRAPYCVLGKAGTEDEIAIAKIFSAFYARYKPFTDALALCGINTTVTSATELREDAVILQSCCPNINGGIGCRISPRRRTY